MSLKTTLTLDDAKTDRIDGAKIVEALQKADNARVIVKNLGQRPSGDTTGYDNRRKAYRLAIRAHSSDIKNFVVTTEIQYQEKTDTYKLAIVGEVDKKLAGDRKRQGKAISAALNAK